MHFFKYCLKPMRLMHQDLRFLACICCLAAPSLWRIDPCHHKIVVWLSVFKLFAVCLSVCLSVCLFVSLSVCPVCHSLRLWIMSCVCVHRLAVGARAGAARQGYRRQHARVGPIILACFENSFSITSSFIKASQVLRIYKYWLDLVPNNIFV